MVGFKTAAKKIYTVTKSIKIETGELLFQPEVFPEMLRIETEDHVKVLRTTKGRRLFRSINNVLQSR